MLTTMTTMHEVTVPTLKGDTQEALEVPKNVEQPTAFILKLFDMINGAPDEVIAVSYSPLRLCRILLLCLQCVEVDSYRRLSFVANCFRMRNLSSRVVQSFQ